jgi:hypothetical protein
MNDRVITDAERFNFLCDCKDWAALDILAERLGDRDGLTKKVDALIKESQGEWMTKWTKCGQDYLLINLELMPTGTATLGRGCVW